MEAVIAAVYLDGGVKMAEQVVVLTVTVRDPSTRGNVELHGTACTQPIWVAGQDGSGPWQRLQPVTGIYRFQVQSGWGGVAWAPPGELVKVRFLSQDELVAGPMMLCSVSEPTKWVTGAGDHYNSIEPQWTYQLGGGGGASSGPFAAFVIEGVRPGVHDLVAYGWSSRIGAYRALIRRDLDLPNGASLGLIDLSGPESMPVVEASISVTSSGLESGGAFSSTMSYLTTPACTVNLLHNFYTMRGIPAAFQRPDDFHMTTVRWNTTNGSVVANEVFHSIANRTLRFPAAVSVSSVAVLPGPYARLEATVPSVPSEYNDLLTLQYTASGKMMSVSASPGYRAVMGPMLAMPDFSAVADWQSSWAIPSGASGSWSVTFEGANGAGSLCTEGRRTVVAVRRGGF